jgi:hypothetical protein
VVACKAIRDNASTIYDAVCAAVTGALANLGFEGAMLSFDEQLEKLDLHKPELKEDKPC